MSQMTKAKVSSTGAKKTDIRLAPKPAAKMAQPEPIKITEELVLECKSKLLQTKADILNRVRESRVDLNTDDSRGGDEADQTVRVLAESEFLNLQERLRNQLLEIESALGRIENGNFGVCEETEEAIEPERLRAIPWTRLSIEGAEIRESITKRFAR